MARPLRNRDHTLLGHAPRDPFASADAPPCPPYWNSDVDFSDVFGGPPRRSSVCHTGHGLGESAGGRGRGRGGVGEEAVAPRRTWSCSSGEKPVFGGIGSPSRRRQMGDDFFDDIFRGNGSACSTPSKTDRVLFFSNPSSRALSPAPPLWPASDVHNRCSSLPAELRFSTRLVKGSDLAEFSSLTPDVVNKNEKSTSDVFSFPSPTACPPTNGRRFVQTRDDPKSDTHASFNKSVLHLKTPHSQYRSSETTKLVSNETSDTERQLKKDSFGLQAHSDSGYFHFSMYKWARIGVTLVMPYSLKERTKGGIKMSGVSTQILHTADHPTDNQGMPQGCRIVQNQCDLEDKSLLSKLATAENHDISLTKDMKVDLPASSDTRSVRNDITDRSDDIDACNKDGVNVSVEAWKPKLENLPQLLNDYSDREGDKEITGQTGNKESMVIDSPRKMKDANDTAKFEQTTRENVFLRTEKATKKMLDTLAAEEDKVIGSRVKGKVKEFVKIFDQEAAPRSGGTIGNQARRPRIRNEIRGRLEACVSASVANADEYKKEKVNNEVLSTPPMAANQSLGIGEKPASDRLLSTQKMDDSSSEVKGILSLLSDYPKSIEGWIPGLPKRLMAKIGFSEIQGCFCPSGNDYGLSGIPIAGIHPSAP